MKKHYDEESEFDRVAEWVYRKGLTGDKNDPLPKWASLGVIAEIKLNQDAFASRVEEIKLIDLWMKGCK